MRALETERGGTWKRLVAVVCAFGLVVVACTSSADPSTTTTPGTAVPTSGPSSAATTSSTTDGAGVTTVPTPEPVGFDQPRRPKALAAFTSFELVPLLAGPAYRGPEWPTDMGDVLIPSYVADMSGVSALYPQLERRGFAIDTNRQFQEFHWAYQEFGYEDAVFYVTTDVAYHYLHLAFSKVLRETEELVLLPILEEFVRDSLETARIQEQEMAGTALEEPASRVTQLFEAATILLATEVGSVGPLASAEAELALEALQFTTSPITSYAECNPARSLAGCVDYSLFKPRGHYTRSPALERYFRTMSLLGQASFFLDQPESVLLGALTSRVVTRPELADGWRRIYEPTAFLVGAADDFTPDEVASAAERVLPGGLLKTDSLADPATLDDLVVELLATRPVAINPEAASIRIMGARFVVDSWIIDQLISPNVGDESGLRTSPSVLDLAAAFGSDVAYRIQDQAGETDFENYDEQLAEMQAFVTGRPDAQWAGTVYDAWLYALQAVWAPRGEQFPDYMRSEDWALKDLQTAFGSYAELKHDTILYAKQFGAAEGDFPPAALDPRHWVEPDPVAFKRMALVLSIMRDGLATRDLLTAENQELTDRTIDMYERLADIATDELAGRPISTADNEWLEGLGSTLEALWLLSSDWDPNEPEVSSGQDWEMAVVADIGRNTFAYLEIGVGLVNRIFVLVPNDAGQFQVAVGGVYSFYEFWQPAESGRLTDEEWREMLRSSPPDRPVWTDVLLGATEPPPTCAEQLAADKTYAETVADFVVFRSPVEWDRDGNGRPCEGDYSASATGRFFHHLADLESGLFCRDLEPIGYTFAEAVAYWLLDGAPDRMDADRNGIPCETVYPSDEIDSFLGR